MIKDDQLIFRYFRYKKNYKKDFKKDLTNRFASMCEFCNRDINSFILLLSKGVYPYEYMDNWERFHEELLPDKETFYSSLKLKDITEVGYRHAKRVSREFNSKNLVYYHNLYV